MNAPSTDRTKRGQRNLKNKLIVCNNVIYSSEKTFLSFFAANIVSVKIETKRPPRIIGNCAIQTVDAFLKLANDALIKKKNFFKTHEHVLYMYDILVYVLVNEQI